jgi:hypothetical protein
MIITARPLRTLEPAKRSDLLSSASVDDGEVVGRRVALIKKRHDGLG